MRTTGWTPLLREVLACPLCRSGIDLAERKVACRGCGFSREQADRRLIDLLPDNVITNDPGWSDRQELMERWYADLSRDQGEASGCLNWDYSGLAPLLSYVRGSVLDIGGGLGLARCFTSSFDEYLIVEPSISWLDDRWNSLAEAFPCLQQPVDVVRGFGEMLPLRSQSFDVALALWSLNHASSPRQVIAEAHRVLRPRGFFIAVLEDVVPTPADIERRPDLSDRENAGLQPDHTRITESDFEDYWKFGFELMERQWVRHYLTFVLARLH